MTDSDDLKAVRDALTSAEHHVVPECIDEVKLEGKLIVEYGDVSVQAGHPFLASRSQTQPTVSFPIFRAFSFVVFHSQTTHLCVFSVCR